MMNRNPVLEVIVEKSYEKLLLSFYDQTEELNSSWTIIGDDEGSLIGLNSNSELYCIDRETKEVVRFMNSSPIGLAKCIQAHKSYGACILQSCSEDQELECVKLFEANIKSVDPSALSNDLNWWSCIIEQCYEGNL